MSVALEKARGECHPESCHDESIESQNSLDDIPDGWTSHLIGKVVTLVNGWAFKPNDWKASGLPIIRIQNLNSGDSEFNYCQGYIEEKYIIHPGDLLFAWSGTTGTSFGARVWKGPKGVLNQHIFHVIPKERILSKNFAFLALQKVQEDIEKEAHGFKASFVHVKKSDLVKIPLHIPQNQSEQEAIAEALSDVDALIDSLEQLITKKRQIKQGVMQDLLTGRKRLPGFDGEWEKYKLGELGNFLKGSGVRKDEANTGSIPCIRYGEIYTDHNDIIRLFRSYISITVAKTATQLQQGDILFAGSGETKEEIGKSVTFVDNVQAYAGGDIVILRTKGHDPTFLGYVLNLPQAQRQKASKGQGDAVVHISANALADIEVPLPKRSEQNSIAEVVSNMDNEISELEARLSKARQIKQGMMQELLTGRIRLV